MVGKRILVIFICVCAVLILIMSFIFLHYYLEYLDEIKAVVTDELGIKNPELELIGYEDVPWSEYKLTHYRVKGTNYIASVQHDQFNVHLIDIDYLYEEEETQN